MNSLEEIFHPVLDPSKTRDHELLFLKKTFLDAIEKLPSTEDILSVSKQFGTDYRGDKQAFTITIPLKSPNFKVTIKSSGSKPQQSSELTCSLVDISYKDFIEWVKNSPGINLLGKNLPGLNLSRLVIGQGRWSNMNLAGAYLAQAQLGPETENLQTTLTKTWTCPMQDSEILSSMMISDA